MDLEQAVEDLAYSKVQLTDVERSLTKNQALLEQAQADLGKASARLEARVRGIYVDGSLSFLEALFSSASLSDFINRFDLLTRIGEQDGKVVAQVSSFRTEVEDKKKRLAEEQASQSELVAQSKTAQKKIEQKLAAREQALRGKESQVAALEREEEARQARLIAEAKEAARLAREAAQKAQKPKTGSSGSASKPADTRTAKPSSGAGTGGSPPASRVGTSVVEIGMSLIGIPYRWAGSSPAEGFDCSGFTMYVFAKVGISLPHSSRAQYGLGRAVDRSELQPGDLVFFGSPIHHLGIYVGNGNMVHSPHTGANVRIGSINRRDYTGARRIS